MTNHVPHPGEILRKSIQDGRWTTSELATRARIPEWQLLRVMSGIQRLTPANCYHLSRVFEAPDYFFNLQAAWDRANPPRGVRPRLAYAFGYAAGMADSLQWHGACSRLFNAGDGMSREMTGRGFDRGQRARVPGAWWR